MPDQLGGKSCLSGITDLTVGASCKINPQRTLDRFGLRILFHDRFHPMVMALARVHGASLEQTCWEAGFFSPFLKPAGQRRRLDPHVVSKLAGAPTASFPLVE